MPTKDDEDTKDLYEYTGINGYSSVTGGFDAEFKSKPEDFRVTEIADDLPRDPHGKYTIARVKLTNWDTNKFVMKLARLLGISHNMITYAGTKDKYAVTTQNFCVNTSVEEFPDIKDVELIDLYRSNKKIALGDLLGNMFEVRLMSGSSLADKFRRIFDEVNKSGGFPNFYGLQRFGSLRPITHIVGRYLVNGDYEGAINEYICDPLFDSESYRLDYHSSHDAEKALHVFPQYLIFERMLLGHVSRQSPPETAFKVFPRNLTMLFVHAFQSFIFNKALSRRIEMVDTLGDILPGDYVVPVDTFFNPDGTEPFKCTRFNLEKLNRLALENKVRAVIKLPGYGTALDDGPMDELISEILSEQGVKLTDFRIGNDKTISSRGSYRIVSALPIDFGMEEDNVIRFTLGRGIYATVFLREFMKGKVLA